MPRTVNTGIYDFDPLMKNAANRVVNEKQVLAVPGRDDFHFLIPQAAPFFVETITVSNETTGEVYQEGKDFVVGHWFVEAMTNTGRAVAGSVRFLRRDIAGIIVLGYHTLGGEWGFNNQAINKELSQRNLNPLVRSWAQIDVMPSTFPPIPHDQRVDSLIGFEDITAKLEDIVQAIETSGSGAGEDHIADRNNPHQTNKGHVGLSNVNNFLIAGEVEAKDRTINTRYMTPWSTGHALDAFYTTRIAKYFDGTVENGTNVTKSQIGLGNVEDLPLATPQEARDGTRGDRYMTPSLTALLIAETNASGADAHAGRRDNPHNVTAAQIGAVTTTDLNTLRAEMEEYLLADETAVDSNKFGGNTIDQFTEALLDQTIANSERFDGKTFLEAEVALGRSFASQYTYYPIYVDEGTVSVDHQWMEVFTRESGGRTTSLILSLPGVDQALSMVQVTIPPSGDAFKVKLLNDVEPRMEIAVRSINLDTQVLCVDVLGMIGSFSLTTLCRLDVNHSVLSVDDHTVHDHTSEYQFLTKSNIAVSELLSTLGTEFEEAADAL